RNNLDRIFLLALCPVHSADPVQKPRRRDFRENLEHTGDEAGRWFGLARQVIRDVCCTSTNLVGKLLLAVRVLLLNSTKSAAKSRRVYGLGILLRRVFAHAARAGWLVGAWRNLASEAVWAWWGRASA